MEQKVDSLERQVARLEGQINALVGKLDELLGLANKGKGVWLASMTAASVLSGIVAYVATYFTHR